MRIQGGKVFYSYHVWTTIYTSSRGSCIGIHLADGFRRQLLLHSHNIHVYSVYVFTAASNRVPTDVALYIVVYNVCTAFVSLL